MAKGLADAFEGPLQLLVLATAQHKGQFAKSLAGLPRSFEVLQHVDVKIAPCCLVPKI